MPGTNTYNKVSTDLLLEIKKIVGENNVFTDPESIEKYGQDQTEHLYFPPEVVVKPCTTDEISNLMYLCSKNNIPVTPRGAGTGLSGGALPQFGGLVISMERMNRILDIDEKNFQVTTEPGVITQVLQNEVKKKGLFYPPDPSSYGSCFIGGNIAENSGGPKAVKYGVVKDYVLNLEIVLPSGEVMWTGANVLKNATGYNLTQLIVGSEGTLAIVTKIVLKLLPLPAFDLLLLAPFSSLEKAGEAVNQVFLQGLLPSAMELVEIDALQIVSEMLGDNHFPVDDNVAAHLIIEVDGNDMDVLYKEMEKISSILTAYGAGEIYFAEDATQKETLWKLRRRCAEAVKRDGYTIEEDTVVPRSHLPALIRGVKQLGREKKFKAVCYGHAGDGNLHIRIKKAGIENSYGNKEMQEILERLFQLVKELGGTISGEHGIGLIQKPYLHLVFQESSLQLMRAIKKSFDPQDILNPGKIFDLV